MSHAENRAYRDRQYRESYKQWIDSLAPEERQKVKELGVDRPSIDREMSQGVLDAEECQIPDVHEHADTAHEHHWEYLRPALGIILAAPNARLAAECLLLASGMDDFFVGGVSQAAIARRHNLTRAAVNKRIRQYCEMLGLSPSRSMRSKETREKYRRARNAYVRRTRSTRPDQQPIAAGCVA